MAAPVRPAAVSTYGKDKWVFVPAIASIAAPKVSEVTAVGVLDVSCYLFDGTDSPEMDVARVKANRRICDTQVFESLGDVSYQGGNLQYAIQPQAAALSDGKKAFEKLVPGTSGYLVRRLGIDVNTDLASGQFVNVYPVTLGPQSIQTIGEGETAEAGVVQPFAFSAAGSQNVAIVI